MAQIIMQSILFGWEPYFLSNLKNKNLALNLNLMLKITTFIGFILLFFFNLTGEYIILFLGNENYIEAKFYILPIITGIVFQELYRIPSSVFLRQKKSLLVYHSTIYLLNIFLLAVFLKILLI